VSEQKREIFLTALLGELRSQHPVWHVDDHQKIEWLVHPRNMWPEADVVIDIRGRRFIVEYDEDSDPGRSLVKYWPILHQASKTPLTIIEVWKMWVIAKLSLPNGWGRDLSSCIHPLPINSSRGKTRQLEQ